MELIIFEMRIRYFEMKTNSTKISINWFKFEINKQKQIEKITHK